MMTCYSISQNKGKHFSEGGEIEEEGWEVGFERVVWMVEEAMW